MIAAAIFRNRDLIGNTVLLIQLPIAICTVCPDMKLISLCLSAAGKINAGRIRRIPVVKTGGAVPILHHFPVAGGIVRRMQAQFCPVCGTAAQHIYMIGTISNRRNIGVAIPCIPNPENLGIRIIGCPQLNSLIILNFSSIDVHTEICHRTAADIKNLIDIIIAVGKMIRGIHPRRIAKGGECLCRHIRSDIGPLGIVRIVGRGFSHLLPLSVDHHLIRNLVAGGCSSRLCIVKGHHIAHHREAVLRVSKANGTILLLFHHRFQNLGSILGKMNRLPLPVGFHRLGIGNGNRYRGGRFHFLAIHLELDIKEPGKKHRLGRAVIGHGRQCLLIIPAVRFGTRRNFRHHQRHIPGKARVLVILHPNRVVRADESFFGQQGLLLR